MFSREPLSHLILALHDLPVLPTPSPLLRFLLTDTESGRLPWPTQGAR